MVTVEIPARELNRFDNEVLKGDYVLKKLRRAGIPVVGSIWPRGATGGLTMICSDAGDLTFNWDGVPPDEEELW